MQPHEHLNQALKMVDDAMKKPKPDVSAGVAEKELGVTGKSDPFEQVRMIAANHSADPVLANFEDAVRNALARHDARKHADDPACDRFEVERYPGGLIGVTGEQVIVSGTPQFSTLWVRYYAETRMIASVQRSTAIELRDALDVLIRATGEDGDE